MSNMMGFLARRFIAGGNFEEALEEIRRLNSMNITTTVDVLGENVNSQVEAKAKANSYIDALGKINSTGVNSHVSLKLTQMGLDISDEFCFENVSRILAAALKYENFVRVDMEGSNYTQRTMELVHRWHESFPNMGIVIQSMLLRSEDDVKELNRRKIPVRLCKGAYKEPPSIAFRDKRDVNENYLKLMRILLSEGTYPAIATHDQVMVDATIDYASQNGIGSDQFEFQMLYGIRRSLQQQIAQDGFRMRIYVPFGTHWFPYYYRRLRERKENIFFILKNLVRH